MTLDDAFARMARPLLSITGVTRSTMMGLPCLRQDGAFFAALDRTTGALLVKLPLERVDELLGSGAAEPFAPAGRRFRQWAAVPPQQTASWAGLLDEARTFAVGSNKQDPTA